MRKRRRESSSLTNRQTHDTYTFTHSIYKKWMAKPYINPLTGRKIKMNAKNPNCIYNKLKLSRDKYISDLNKKKDIIIKKDEYDLCQNDIDILKNSFDVLNHGYLLNASYTTNLFQIYCYLNTGNLLYNCRNYNFGSFEGTPWLDLNINDLLIDEYYYVWHIPELVKYFETNIDLHPFNMCDMKTIKVMRINYDHRKLDKSCDCYLSDIYQSELYKRKNSMNMGSMENGTMGSMENRTINQSTFYNYSDAKNIGITESYLENFIIIECNKNFEETFDHLIPFDLHKLKNDTSCKIYYDILNIWDMYNENSSFNYISEYNKLDAYNVINKLDYWTNLYYIYKYIYFVNYLIADRVSLYHATHMIVDRIKNYDMFLNFGIYDEELFAMISDIISITS